MSWKGQKVLLSPGAAAQTINFYVSPSEGHDDLLMSLALVVEAAELPIGTCNCSYTLGFDGSSGLFLAFHSLVLSSI